MVALKGIDTTQLTDLTSNFIPWDLTTDAPANWQDQFSVAYGCGGMFRKALAQCLKKELSSSCHKIHSASSDPSHNASNDQVYAPAGQYSPAYSAYNKEHNNGTVPSLQPAHRIRYRLFTGPDKRRVRRMQC